MRSLAKIVERGHLVRGAKPVHWCFDCGSALAEAEIEYADKASPAIDVAYDARDPQALARAVRRRRRRRRARRDADLDHHAVDAAGEPGGHASARNSITCWSKARARPTAVVACWCWPKRWPARRWRVTASTTSSCSAARWATIWKACCCSIRSMPNAISRCWSATTCPPKTAPAWCTPRPGHGQEDYAVGLQVRLDRPLHRRADEPGRCARRVPAVDAAGGRHRARRPAHLEGQRRARRRDPRQRSPARRTQAHAQLPALLAPQDAGRVPRHAAVVHLDGAGRPAQRRAARDRQGRLGAGVGRGAHLQHDRRPPGLDASRASATGACRSRCSSIARPARSIRVRPS